MTSDVGLVYKCTEFKQAKFLRTCNRLFYKYICIIYIYIYIVHQSSDVPDKYKNRRPGKPVDESIENEGYDDIKNK